MRRRTRRTDNPSSGLVGLLVLGCALYAAFGGLAWHWQVVTLVLGATLLFLLIRSFLRKVQRGERERLMLADVQARTGQEFEFYVQSLLRALGWQDVKHTGGSGDEGIDLRALRNGERWIVQCKHRQRDVVINTDAVRATCYTLIRTIRSGQADRALFVTTGRFGPQARQQP